MLKHNFKAMGGPAQLYLEENDPKTVKNALIKILVELERIEEKYSYFIDSSLTAQINESAGTGRSVRIDEEYASLLQYADTLHNESNGAFDPTAGVLRKLWKFDQPKLPDPIALSRKLASVGWGKLEWTNKSARLPFRCMQIDLGGIVKEYAVDFATQIVRDFKIESALVDLSGDISAIGKKPNGLPWEISIRHPRRPDKSAAFLKLENVAVATSGDYERSFVLDGKRYSHLLNPKTGWPLDGLASCTVISKQCLIAGGTATTSLLKEKQESCQWLEDVGLPYLAVDTTMNTYSNMQDHFSCKSWLSQENTNTETLNDEDDLADGLKELTIR